jgi:5-hydroxyisourate hydrolase-like protein (transthyretin family)
MIRKFAALFLLLFALALPFASYAEEEERLAVHINELRVPQMVGVVQNRRGEPVAGVRVEIFRRADGHVMGNAKTDEQGRFSYPKLKNGKYNIRVHHDGYADFYHVHVTPQKASPELVLKYK